MNRLARERSPYLLQHANNPVDWYPWTSEAFDKARSENKPIFLSIGYSTCHWCHVMEQESFENDDIARVLNEHFVSIKVDREERPDVDRVYMTFVQATTGSGGWPMSVWLTPELKPFYGGTYFPPSSKWGRPGFAEILQEITRVWRADREKVVDSAEHVTEQLRAGDHPRAACDAAWRRRAAAHRRAVPPVVRRGPRRIRRRAEVPQAKRAAVPLARACQDRRCRRGADGPGDAAGDGARRHARPRWRRFSSLFSRRRRGACRISRRCCTTRRSSSWLMSRGPRRSPTTGLLSVAEDTLNYVLREMTHRDGGFFSAEDADSVPPEAAGIRASPTRPRARSICGRPRSWTICLVHTADLKVRTTTIRTTTMPRS